MIEWNEQQLFKNLELAAKQLVKLDWPTDLVVCLENGKTRKLTNNEHKELIQFVKEYYEH